MIKKILINVILIFLISSCVVDQPKVIKPTKLNSTIEYIEYKDKEQEQELKKNQIPIDPIIYSFLGLVVFQSIVILFLCITMWKKTKYFEQRLLNDKNL